MAIFRARVWDENKGEASLVRSFRELPSPISYTDIMVYSDLHFSFIITDQMTLDELLVVEEMVKTDMI